MTDDYIKMARADCECVVSDLVEQIKERNARIAELEMQVAFIKPVELAQHARIAELEAALKPFADLAEKYDGDVDDQPIWDRDFMPVVGDLRAARAAVEKNDD